MDEFAEMAAREREAKRSRAVSDSGSTLRCSSDQVILFVIWLAADVRSPWFAFALFAWGMILAATGSTPS